MTSWTLALGLHPTPKLCTKQLIYVFIPYYVERARDQSVKASTLSHQTTCVTATLRPPFSIQDSKFKFEIFLQDFMHILFTSKNFRVWGAPLSEIISSPCAWNGTWNCLNRSWFHVCLMSKCINRHARPSTSNSRQLPLLSTRIHISEQLRHNHAL